MNNPRLVDIHLNYDDNRAPPVLMASQINNGPEISIEEQNKLLDLVNPTIQEVIFQPYNSPEFQNAKNTIQAILDKFLYERLLKKCECGAEKARTTHSRWCPRWS